MIPPIADRFIAGETPAGAIERARQLNEQGVKAMVNKLGSHHRERRFVTADASDYRLLVDDIARSGLDASITIKPSQIGLDIGEDVFRELLGEIVAAATEGDVIVWLDMEEPTTVDATLDAYEALAYEYGGGIGVCVQANLKRSREDIERLREAPGKVRLVKGGAYDVPESIAYNERARIDRAYRELLDYVFEHYDGGVAVASHDPEMIEYAIALHEEHGTDFEIQMLMGVRAEAQTELANEYDVWQYVPYGKHWKMYFFNRATENTRNLRFALRAIVGGAT